MFRPPLGRGLHAIRLPKVVLQSSMLREQAIERGGSCGPCPRTRSRQKPNSQKASAELKHCISRRYICYATRGLLVILAPDSKMMSVSMSCFL